MNHALNNPETKKRALEARKGVAPENNLFVKNIGNTTSRQTAIAAMCAHCMGCNAKHMEPGYKQDIRNCKAVDCPLHGFRPYQ